MLEKEIENYFKINIEKKGGLAIKLAGTGLNGIPDRLVLIPGGKVIFVEFKAPGKKPRKLQEYVINKLRNLGFKVFVIDNKEQAMEVIESVV